MQSRNVRFYAGRGEAWNRSESDLSTKERERLKVLHEVEQGHLRRLDAARRLRLTRPAGATFAGATEGRRRSLESYTVCAAALRTARFPRGLSCVRCGNCIRPVMPVLVPPWPANIGGDDGQLALSLAGRTRPGLSSARPDRRRQQPRVGPVGGARREENLRTLGGWLAR